MFSCEYYQIFKHSFFYRIPPVAMSAITLARQPHFSGFFTHHNTLSGKMHKESYVSQLRIQ